MTRESLIVLDGMDTPDGVLQLVTYRDRDVTWVGIGKKEKGLFSAIGLHTGSRDSEVETSASIDRGWGVVFGAVAPGIVRAEVHNDDGEAFPVRIVALPEGFDPDYRAVWGLAERCAERCDLIGFDAEGRPYDQSDPRVFGPPPSDTDRLGAIRAHADGSMRYYATAYLRESEGNRRLIENSMATTANFLALLEGAALDHRSMLARREKIIQRNIEQAKTDPWEPGTCSFCGTRPVAAWFEGPDFRTFVRSSAEVRAKEAWLAREMCLALVEADDRHELARRGAERHRPHPHESVILIERSLQHVLEPSRSRLTR
jgi:hypothetical protein